MSLEFVFHSSGSLDGLSPITQSSGVCFDDQGRILIFRQEGKAWNLPGGTPEAGESLEETVEREVYEETTVKISACKLIGYQEVIEDGKTIAHQARFACLVERIDPQRPDPDKGKIHERTFVEPSKAMEYIPYKQIEQIIEEAVKWHRSI